MVLRLDEAPTPGVNEMSHNCLFCKIGAKKIPAKLV